MINKNDTCFLALVLFERIIPYFTFYLESETLPGMNPSV